MKLGNQIHAKSLPGGNQSAVWPSQCFKASINPVESMVPTADSRTAVSPSYSVARAPAISQLGDMAAESPRRGPLGIPCAIAFFCMVGIALAYWLRTIPAGNPDPRLSYNVFFYLFAHHEPAGLLIVTLFNLAAALFFFRRRQARDEADMTAHRAVATKLATHGRLICVVIAAVVCAIASIGTSTVFHDYLLTADENLADFQARIFLCGKVQADVPANWAPAANVIRPTHSEYFPATHRWNASYLPVYAAMRALFQSIDLQSLLNPLLAALTILALYGTIRNIWPESETNALIAIGLLASSSQFLLMSMTGYAMAAHLALNSIWLWLYSQPGRRVFYFAPAVGVLAIGLHQPIVHALFVLPFLVRLVWQRKWRPVLIFGAIYFVGCAFWYAWKTHFASPLAGDIGSIFRLVNAQMIVVQPMNLLLIITWASLATPLLLVLGFGQLRQRRPIVQDAIVSCVLTFGFYYFFYLDQAHGWGYRYIYGSLGCFIIVAVAGIDRLSSLIGERRAVTFAAIGIALSILVQLPLRCMQAERFVRPYARASETLHAIHADIVAFDPRDAWYSADLIRNDPFLEQRPIIVSLFRLTSAGAAALDKNGTARFITRDELARLGLFTTRRDRFAYDPFKLGSGP